MTHFGRTTRFSWNENRVALSSVCKAETVCSDSSPWWSPTSTTYSYTAVVFHHTRSRLVKLQMNNRLLQENESYKTVILQYKILKNFSTASVECVWSVCAVTLDRHFNTVLRKGQTTLTQNSRRAAEGAVNK